MANPGSFCPNPLQIQYELKNGNGNAQPGIPFPFANLNTGFATNQLFPFPQGTQQNPDLNLIAHYQMNNNNSSQASGSFLSQNAMNPPQFLPNGQLNLLNNVNQLPQMQMPGCGPVASQNINLVVSGQAVLVNANGVMQQGNNVSQHMPPNVTKQLHSNSPLGKTSACPQSGWNQNNFSPGSSKPQSNLGKVNGVNKIKKGWNKSHDKNFSGNLKFDALKRGFPNPRFHHKQKKKANFKFNNENRRKGHVKVNLALSVSNEQIQVRKKSTLSLNYTEQEIQQWREERRKNHPSQTKIENKSKEDQTDPGATDVVSKIRRQQLKEILAKQAELGCEVAKIPSCYLSDSEQQADGRGENKQSNLGKVNGVNKIKNGWNKSHYKNFSGNPKFDALKRGFPNPRFHHKQNKKANFKFNNENRRKGHDNINLALSVSNEQIQVREKSTLSLIYTEQEIQQWREERRKNHPSQTKIENKLNDQTDPGATDVVCKIRSQQLKEILAKQAVLGRKVANIPSCYLSDSEHQADTTRSSKRQRPVNHYSKNLHGQKNQFTKRQRVVDDGSIIQCTTNKREPFEF